MLYIDFSAAFNITDHDKLLLIMYNMGFTTDVVNVTAGLYANAEPRSTCVTDPVDIKRGTIQTDTLSPLLFLVLLEFLQRWLQFGGSLLCLLLCLTPVSCSLCIPLNSLDMSAGLLR